MNIDDKLFNEFNLNVAVVNTEDRYDRLLRSDKKGAGHPFWPGQNPRNLGLSDYFAVELVKITNDPNIKTNTDSRFEDIWICDEPILDCKASLIKDKWIENPGFGNKADFELMKSKMKKVAKANRPAGSSHHNQTKKVLILSYYIDISVKIAAIYYASNLTPDDWGKINKLGSKTTPACSLNPSGLNKLKLVWSGSPNKIVREYIDYIERNYE
jgi:hypothetical protein